MTAQLSDPPVSDPPASDPRPSDPLLVERGNVERLHAVLRDRAAAYEFKPGERVNEGALARQLGVSRTPVREALNRLTAEGFFTFEPGRGFFCRPLEPKQIYDLYQLRLVLELGALRLAVAAASDADIAGLVAFLAETGPDDAGRSSEELVGLDETFHERLAGLTGNAEITSSLRNVNARIRFVRWIDMEQRRTTTQGEHQLILAGLARRDTDAAAAAMGSHIEKRLDQITAALKEGYSRIYLGRA